MVCYMKAERLYIQLRDDIEKSRSIPPCQTTDPELWYGETGEDRMDYKLAKQFCTRCPVVDVCLAYAIEANELEGVWGGLSPSERQAMRNAQNRTRTRRPNFKEMV